MPSLFVASITVAPFATSTGLPSTSIFSMAGQSYVGRHEASLVVDVVLEFVAEMLDEALHRQRPGRPQRADRAPRDIVGHRRQPVEVFVAALSVFDAVHHAPEP